LNLGVVTCDTLDKAERIIGLGRPEMVLLEESSRELDGVALLADYLGTLWPGTPLLLEESGRPAEETATRCASMLGLLR
jgi:hypothetical protein